MGSIFTLEADDPQTDTIISKLQKSQVKNSRVSPLTNKKNHSFNFKAKQNKPNKTRPTTTKRREPKKKETTHFRLSHLTTNFHHSTTYSDDDDDDEITHNNATQWQIRTTEDNSQYRKQISLR
jgi:hypothetical protein